MHWRQPQATKRSVYFPKGASWTHLFTKEVVQGGQTKDVAAPIETFPVYVRG